MLSVSGRATLTNAAWRISASRAWMVASCAAFLMAGADGATAQTPSTTTTMTGFAEHLGDRRHGFTSAAQSNPLLEADGTLSRFNAVNDPAHVDTPQELDDVQGAPQTLSSDELSKELSNPNSPLARLSFDTIYTSFEGDLPGADDQYSVTTVFQPIFPFPLTDDGTLNFFARPGLPIAWRQPSFDPAAADFDNVAGLGDIGFDAAIGKSLDGGFILVAGIQGTLPTGTEADLTGGQFRLGPEFAAAYITETGYLFAFPQHQWNVGGWRDEQHSTSVFEFNAGFYLPNAWTLFTNPKVRYDWVDEQWTVPLNLGIRKVTSIGSLPLQVVVKADYYVEQNDAFGEGFAVTLNVTPVVSNFIYNALFD